MWALAGGAADFALDDGLVQVMAARLAGLSVDVRTRRGKNPLPRELARAEGYLR